MIDRELVKKLFPVRWKIYDELFIKDGTLYALWHSWQCSGTTIPLRISNPRDPDDISGYMEIYRSLGEEQLLHDLNHSQYLDVYAELQKIESLGITDWEPDPEQKEMIEHYGLKPYQLRRDEERIVLEKHRNELLKLREDFAAWFVAHHFKIPTIPVAPPPLPPIIPHLPMTTPQIIETNTQEKNVGSMRGGPKEYRGTVTELADRALGDFKKGKYRSLREACRDYAARYTIRAKPVNESSLYTTASDIQRGERKRKNKQI